MEKEEKKKRILQNVGIAALSIVIIGLLALCIYMLFIKKEGSDIDNNDQNNYVFTTLERSETADYHYQYVTNHFTLISRIAQCDEVFEEAVDKKGNKLTIKDNYYQVNNLQIENGKLIAYGTSDCPCDSTENSKCQVETKVEFIYDGTSITINKISKEENDANFPVSYSKIDETKGTYYVIKGNTYDLYSNFENKYEKHDNEKISFDYPVININTNSVKKLNSDIKIMYDNLLNEIKNENDEYGCTCIKVENKYYCNEHIKEYSYGIYETTDFITININWTLHTDCAGGYSSNYLYTVSKRTGEVLNDKDIIDSLGYNRDKINKELPTYIQSLYHEDISSELENITNYLSFFPYDRKLVIGYEIIDGTEYVLYDGKNFKEVDYSTFNSIFKK